MNKTVLRLNRVDHVCADFVVPTVVSGSLCVTLYHTGMLFVWTDQWKHECSWIFRHSGQLFHSFWPLSWAKWQRPGGKIMDLHATENKLSTDLNKTTVSHAYRSIPNHLTSTPWKIYMVMLWKVCVWSKTSMCMDWTSVPGRLGVQFQDRDVKILQ